MMRRRGRRAGRYCEHAIAGHREGMHRQVAIDEFHDGSWISGRLRSGIVQSNQICDWVRGGVNAGMRQQRHNNADGQHADKTPDQK